MLVGLGLVEQRYKAVLEVRDNGMRVLEVARRYGVGRQTVHKWLRCYAAEGLPGLTPSVGATTLTGVAAFQRCAPSIADERPVLLHTAAPTRRARRW